MLHLRPMTLADLGTGMFLKKQAGWNQVEADWVRFLELEPDGCFLAEWDGQPVGTVATARFHDVGWVALLLVHADYRNRGVGSALLERAMQHLSDHGTTTIRLDAAPLGQPIYEKKGYMGRYQVLRYRGRPNAIPVAASSCDLRPLAENPEAWLTLDRTAVGSDRRRWLTRLASEHFGRGAWNGAESLGYVMARPGSNAWQLGPCIATNAAAAQTLVSETLRQHPDREWFVDVPAPNAAMRAFVEGLGFVAVRTFLRMDFGVLAEERVDWHYSGSGPEMG